MEFLWTSKPWQENSLMAKSLLCPVCVLGGSLRAHCMQCLFFIVAVTSSLGAAADINHLCVETRQACVTICVSPYSEHSSKHAI